MTTARTGANRDRMGTAIRPMRTRSPAITAALLATAVAAGAVGCATLDAGPRAIPIASGPAPRAHIDEIHDYADAIPLIADILERDVGLPPARGTLYLHADRAHFEAALLEQGYSEPLARETAQIMAAIGGADKVIANAGAFSGQAWPQRIATLAHELVHVAQYEMGGGTRGTSDQWLREGLAELLSHRVLESLGLVRLAQIRQRARLIVLDADAQAPLPRLVELVTFPEWVRAGSRHRSAPLYPLAPIAIGHLVETHALEAVLAYFRRFATSSNREQNFLEAFGETVQSFDAGFWKAVRAEPQR